MRYCSKGTCVQKDFLFNALPYKETFLKYNFNPTSTIKWQNEAKTLKSFCFGTDEKEHSIETAFKNKLVGAISNLIN